MTIRKLSAMGAALALVGALSACGYDRGDRIASGGLIGAGGGALVGAAVGGSPAIGALVGAGAGAVAGGATSGNDVNLGKPVWR
jgi:hypothetical protein